VNGELWRWQASDLAQAISKRQVSSREAVTSCLARLEEVNPRINAVVDVMAGDALAAADHADKIIAWGEAVGPLHGVPVTIKINVDCAGRATTNGVVTFRDRIAETDSPSVANWRKAGAIVIGRTNVPAFSARFFTDNALYGRTLNPWDVARTPGGSSGGAAAAVATGIGPLAHGNDRAGSIRYPAFACGVVGLRPTIGVVPTFESTAPGDPTITTQLTHVQGPLARSVGDVRLGLLAMAGHDSRDPWWVPADLDAGTAVRSVRVAMIAHAPGIEIDQVISATIQDTARWLEDAGYRVEEVAPPRLEEAAEMFFTLIRTEEKAGTTKAIERFGDDALRRARASTMRYAGELDFEGYIQAFGRRASILREWMLFFERYSLLLMPVSWERPFPVDFDQQGDNAVRRMLTAHHPMLAISILGLPALAIPTGVADGVPIGVQLVAARFHEHVCLRAGEAIEAWHKVMTPIDPRF
jgi:amidase